jgi:cell division protease FtsH
MGSLSAQNNFPNVIKSDGTRTSRDAIRLKDLHGMDAAREWGEALARDLADFIRGRLTWDDIDRGALIFGPPGCGKTMFAKALATTCGVPLIVASYSKWQTNRSGHLGRLLKAMRNDFDDTMENAPAILFIDEIDVFSNRDDPDMQYREWWVSVTNALLECLDGARGREGAIVIGATNRPNNIDPALVRAGRLDREIRIDLPTPAAIEGIIRHYLRGELERESLCAIAAAANGLTGADIESIVRRARRTARHQNRRLALQDLFDHLEEEGRGRSPEMLWRAAVHEAGHAAVAILLEVAAEVSLSLVQRKQAGGYTAIAMRAQCPTRDQIERQIACMLAGRAAEKVILGRVSAGAGGSNESDLARATDLAASMVTSYGLSENENLIYFDNPTKSRLLIQLPEVREQVHAILGKSHAQACMLIDAHESQICKLAHELVKRRGLTDPEIRSHFVNTHGMTLKARLPRLSRRQRRATPSASPSSHP